MGDLLPMFFDEEFVPHAYLDALFEQSSINSQTNSINDLTSLKHIQLLQQRTTMLLSNLDYYTNEMTNDLEQKISTLQQSNSIISYSYDQNHSNYNTATSDDINSKLKPTTRLEYYIDSFSISVNSLNEQIANISKDLNNIAILNSQNDKVTGDLLKLTKSKENLIKVRNTLETVRSVVDISIKENEMNSTTKVGRNAPTNTRTKKEEKNLSVKLVEFNSSLSILKDTIVESFKEKSKTESPDEIDHVLLKKIDNLIELLPIFKNLSNFYTNYSNFTKVLKVEKEEYLKLKNLDKNDELFKEILQK